MRSFAELREFAQLAARSTKEQLPDVGTCILMWNKGSPVTLVAVAGNVEAQRNMPRMLREVADKLEAEQGKMVITPS